MQTAGKTYLATSENIARYTGGRFTAAGLATTARALSEPVTPPQNLPSPSRSPSGRVGLLIGEDDLHPETLEMDADTKVLAIAGVSTKNDRSRLVRAFIGGAIADALDRAASHFRAPIEMLAEPTADIVRDWALRHDVQTIIVAHAPVGPGSTAHDTLKAALAEEGISLIVLRRPWDSKAWPEAKRGYFPFRQKAAALTT